MHQLQQVFFTTFTRLNALICVLSWLDFFLLTHEVAGEHKDPKVHNFSTASITNKHPLPHHFMRKSDFLDPLRIQTAPEHNLIFHYLKGDLQEAIKYSYPPMKALTNFFYRPENTLRGAGGKGSEERGGTSFSSHIWASFKQLLFTVLHPSTQWHFLIWGECLYGGDTPKHLTPLFAPCVLCIRAIGFLHWVIKYPAVTLRSDFAFKRRTQNCTVRGSQRPTKGKSGGKRRGTRKTKMV